MDWTRVIERNRERLAGVIAGLIPLAEAMHEVPNPGPLCRFIARILRPAEAALRRLIVIVAAVLQARAKVVEAAGWAASAKSLPDFSAFASGTRRPALSLFDPRKRFGGDGKFSGFERILPRISVPGFIDPAPAASPGGTLDIATLLRRIEKLDHALKTLPRQARRLIRLMAKRSRAEPGPGKVGPIRPGLPPGHRRRSQHEVHTILGECHFLARTSGLRPP